MLAVEVTIGQNKYVFCTVYRVGTLGDVNHDSIFQSIKSLYKGRTLKKIFIIGDFNLSSANWPLDDGNTHSLNRIDKLFVDSFSELGLSQLITGPTHIKGRTLDILLTNQSPLVSNVEVKNDSYICKSDHFPVHFKVNVRSKIRSPMALLWHSPVTLPSLLRHFSVILPSLSRHFSVTSVTLLRHSPGTLPALSRHYVVHLISFIFCDIFRQLCQN